MLEFSGDNCFLAIPNPLYFVSGTIIALSSFVGFAETVGEREYYYAAIAFDLKIFRSSFVLKY